MPVEVVHFNPLRRRPGPVGRVLPRKRLNNFGDLIGPIIVERLVAEFGLTEPTERRRLVAVGSIMKLTRSGDTVWGTGVNGKSMDAGAAPDIDVRAVRGPHTRRALLDRGTAVPEVYGDPALLWPRFWPLEEYRRNSSVPRRAVSVVPNFHDRGAMTGPNVIDPLQDPFTVIEQIAQSDFVCGSSLHGIALAEAFGIPARLIEPGAEPAFKYLDYYAGTGRSSYRAAGSVEEALNLGGERPIDFDAEALVAAFPRDLWN
ncbi:polysaccharide pyruvyl transferase family protein [Microbacterium sp. JZ70]